MVEIERWMKGMVIAAVALTAAACASYPSEPRYSIYADRQPASPAAPPAPAPAPVPYGEGVVGPTNPANEVPPPLTAPVGVVEGGTLPSLEDAPPPPSRPASTITGAAYVIQPGDTISGVGRRFQTPVQTLIDLNALGPRAALSPGQRIILPDTAVDTGSDPYATGPSPTGVLVPNRGAPPPPPPPPPSGNPASPPPARPNGSAATTVALDWPVRGDILRRFGPVGLGERNNGINIGAPAGAEVRASAAGRVGYVGDDLAGQGLTVLVVHRDGWRTVYGHLGSATVRDGDDVRAGQSIGTVGLTAGDGRPSIHYEVWRMRGDEPSAIDPLTLLPR